MSEHKRSKSGGKQPITRHALFPAIVALWFGALFGLGSIAVSPALIGRGIVALGIDNLLPMAAPPLGTTARILIALAMTGIGGLAGVLLARRLARPAPDVHERRRGTLPIEDEERTAVTTKQVTGRRRGPGAQPDVQKSDYYEAAPIPGQATQILSVDAFDLDGFEDADEAETAPRFEGDVIDAEAEPAAKAGPTSLNSSLFETYSRNIPQRAEPETPKDTAEAPSSTSGPNSFAHFHGNAWDEIETEPDAGPDTGMVIEPKEEPQTVTAGVAETGPSHDEHVTDGDLPAKSDKRTAAERIASAELDELSPVELLERLALAMAQRREGAKHARTAPAPTPMLMEVEPEQEPEPEVEAESETTDFEQLDREPLPFEIPRFEAAPLEAAEAPAEAETPATIETSDLSATQDSAAEAELTRIPAAMRPVNFDDFADDDDALPAYIPPRHIGLAPGHAENRHDEPEHDSFVEDEEDEEEEALDEGYSSLLDLSRPMGNREKQAQQFIRIDEPEDSDEIQSVVIFPGEEAREGGPFSGPAPEHEPTAEPVPSAETALVEAQQDRGTRLPASGERLFDNPGQTAPEDTERALRAALATLQRMSGAA